jgi:ABC-type transport system involved in multi-copper enzyme maturation permease subunit
MIAEVLRESLFRRRFIPLLHIVYLGVYLLVYGIFCVIPSGPTRWGLWLFIWSGCLLPVLLTAGAFGDDIASGRILQLVTKPVSLGTLYVLRALGVFIQCAVHLAVCYSLVFVLHSLTGQGGQESLGPWFLASLLASLAWLTLSCSLSTFLLREYNIVVIMIGSILVVMLWQSVVVVASVANWPMVSEVANGVVVYGMPPVVLLLRLGMQKYNLVGGLAVGAHALGMATLYAAIGILILTHREFLRRRE